MEKIARASQNIGFRSLHVHFHQGHTADLIHQLIHCHHVHRLAFAVFRLMVLRWIGLDLQI